MSRNKTLVAQNPILLFLAGLLIIAAMIVPAQARTLVSFEPGDIIGVNVACETASSVVKVLSEEDPQVTDCFQTSMTFPCLFEAYAGEVRDNTGVKFRVVQCAPLAPLGFEKVYTAERVDQKDA